MDISEKKDAQITKTGKWLHICSEQRSSHLIKHSYYIAIKKNLRLISMGKDTDVVIVLSIHLKIKRCLEKPNLVSWMNPTSEDKTAFYARSLVRCKHSPRAWLDFPMLLRYMHRYRNITVEPTSKHSWYWLIRNKSLKSGRQIRCQTGSTLWGQLCKRGFHRLHRSPTCHPAHLSPSTAVVWMVRSSVHSRFASFCYVFKRCL